MRNQNAAGLQRVKSRFVPVAWMRSECGLFKLQNWLSYSLSIAKSRISFLCLLWQPIQWKETLNYRLCRISFALIWTTKLWFYERGDSACPSIALSDNDILPVLGLSYLGEASSAGVKPPWAFSLWLNISPEPYYLQFYIMDFQTTKLEYIEFLLCGYGSSSHPFTFHIQFWGLVSAG